MATVALIGTLDTKGAEYEWLATKVREHDAEVLTIDIGPLSDARADITSAQVAEAAGSDLAKLRQAADRGAAMETMATGAAAVLRERFDRGEAHAVLALGGSGGSSVAAWAMRALPVGVPTVLVSTMASGDVSPYVGESDVTMMYSVVDVAGINSVSERVFGNAASGTAAMAREEEARQGRHASDSRPLVGVTMFGLTTPAADEARAELDRLGYEPLVFHATGAGGRAMEKLIEDGRIVGVVDLTTTELADDLVGGVLSAGPHRLEAAGRAGVPQVVSLGALDMVNFGPKETVPERFSARTFLVHNPTVTLMRTTREENLELGHRIGRKLAAATGSVTLLIPGRGLSGIDADGGPFRDEEADEALSGVLREELAGTAVEVVERDQHINDEGFGQDAAQRLHAMLTAR